MKSLNISTQFSILRANISNALMLVQVLGFNMKTANEEVEFVFNDNDRQLLSAHAQTQSPKIPTVKINEILNHVPVPEAVKHTLYSLMEACANPILGDTTVFVLMLMLVIFTGDDEPVVSRLSAQYWTMLRRYLTRKCNNRVTVESQMVSIRTCLDTLPLMARPFIQMEEASP